jgi:hypothetical protein
MKPINISYKGYVIEITENPRSYKYEFIIRKDDKVIVQSPESYTFAEDAEVNAKMIINSRTSKF